MLLILTQYDGNAAVVVHWYISRITSKLIAKNFKLWLLVQHVLMPTGAKIDHNTWLSKIVTISLAQCQR